MTNINYTQKLGIGDILSEAKHLFFDNISAYMKIFLILLLPLVIVQVIAEFIPKLLMMLLYIAAVVVYIIGSVALIKQTDKFISGEKNFNFEALRKESGTYFWQYLGLAIGMSLLLMLLFLLLIIPGIIFAIFWAFAVTALILKNTSPVESMRYSKKLVQGRWWSVLGYLFVFGLFSLLLALPLIVISVLAAFAPTGVTILLSLVYLIGMYVLSMYFTTVQVVYFKNMDALYGEKKPVKKVATKK